MNQFLFPIIVQGKYGYINQLGDVVIKPQFDVAKKFSEGLARVKLDGKWGFVDESGYLAIKPFYELKSSEEDNLRYLDFHEDKAAFSISGEKSSRKWGYLNKQGEVVIDPVWDYADEFSEGIARVGRKISYQTGRIITKTSEGFYIDGNGQILNFSVVGETFSEGIAVFHIREDGGRKEKSGYIDKNGNVIIDPQKRICESFSQGLARARTWNSDEWGFIDKKGNLICEMNFRNADDFSEYKARVHVEDWDNDTEGWGFIDELGEIAIAPRFAAVGNFSNEVAVAGRMPDENSDNFFQERFFGYIDSSGKWIIEPQFTYICGDFHNELALVSEGQKWGYINQMGDYVWSSEEQIYNSENSVFSGFSVLRKADDKILGYEMGLEFTLF